MFVNHKPQQCGVYEFGKAIGKALSQSSLYNFIYCESDNFSEFRAIFKRESPSVVIYNYHPATMRWIGKQYHLYKNAWFIPVPQIGMIHEITQEVADTSTRKLFNFRIAADSTLQIRNPRVFWTNRLIPRFTPKPVQNNIPTFGSFGFATPGKGFERIVEKVQGEYDEAVINIIMPFSKYADENGTNAKRLSENIHALIQKKGIQLNINHNYLSTEGILKFLSQNDLNLFLYDYQENRGIASVTDLAIAAQQPIAITKSSMFRHLHNLSPSICIEDNPIKTILKNGNGPIKKLYAEWSPANLCKQYEQIVMSVLNRGCP